MPMQWFLHHVYEKNSKPCSVPNHKIVPDARSQSLAVKTDGKRTDLNRIRKREEAVANKFRCRAILLQRLTSTFGMRYESLVRQCVDSCISKIPSDALDASNLRGFEEIIRSDIQIEVRKYDSYPSNRKAKVTDAEVPQLQVKPTAIQQTDKSSTPSLATPASRRTSNVETQASHQTPLIISRPQSAVTSGRQTPCAECAFGPSPRLRPHSASPSSHDHIAYDETVSDIHRSSSRRDESEHKISAPSTRPPRPHSAVNTSLRENTSIVKSPWQIRGSSDVSSPRDVVNIGPDKVASRPHSAMTGTDSRQHTCARESDTTPYRVALTSRRPLSASAVQTEKSRSNLDRNNIRNEVQKRANKRDKDDYERIFGDDKEWDINGWFTLPYKPRLSAFTSEMAAGLHWASIK